MRTFPLLVVAVAVCGLPLVAYAHTGGALDAEGCHADHRKGTYHCHRGEAAGYTFPNRAAMQDAVRTGKFPEKSVDSEGFFEKLWPWGNKHEQQPAAPGAAPEGTDSEPTSPAAQAPESPAPEAAAPAAGPAAAAERSVAERPVVGSPPAAAAPAAPQNEYERRLKVLQGLYEMGLISREEYEAKRKEVLGQL